MPAEPEKLLIFFNLSFFAYSEKNSFFDESKEDDNDFEFNQDLQIDEGTRSPGWIRYQKRIK